MTRPSGGRAPGSDGCRLVPSPLVIVRTVAGATWGCIGTGRTGFAGDSLAGMKGMSVGMEDQCHPHCEEHDGGNRGNDGHQRRSGHDHSFPGTRGLAAPPNLAYQQKARVMGRARAH
jgi:hypothetical protein